MQLLRHTLHHGRLHHPSLRQELSPTARSKHTHLPGRIVQCPARQAHWHTPLHYPVSCVPVSLIIYTCSLCHVTFFSFVFLYAIAYTQIYSPFFFFLLTLQIYNEILFVFSVFPLHVSHNAILTYTFFIASTASHSNTHTHSISLSLHLSLPLTPHCIYTYTYTLLYNHFVISLSAILSQWSNHLSALLLSQSAHLQYSHVFS